METIPALLEARLRAAAESPEATIQPATDPRFGDYQSNIAMVLAKQRRANPRQLAQEIIARLDLGPMCDPAEIAGAGFINFRLRPDWLAARFSEFLADARLGVPRPAVPRKLVVDFSSPNVAKPMHVGHIRSTILGDALARIAELLGHEVVRDNHLGDWGTQFGMLLVGWKTELDRAALEGDALSEMERIYKLISARTKEDPATLQQVHAELVKLQAGDEENLALWREMIRLSQRQFNEIYGRLGIRFDVTLGESFYNPFLQPVVEELIRLGIARESEGAICVFSDGTLPPEKDPFLIKDETGWRPNPAIIRKKDGAANYTTSDLATLQYRLREWSPSEIVYVTDGRQQLHFRQLFSIFQRWQPEAAGRVRLAHVWFGSILGEDGKPFKTRSGETIRLAELLDEAEERALKIVVEKSPALPAEEAREIARRIGLGAVKYADLLPNRQSDYVFSWERMLSLAGNTAPYLQNAYVRIRSIFRKLADEKLPEPDPVAPLTLAEPAEIALAKRLLQFGEVVPQILNDHRPNLLANYLFDLANTYHSFYESCPVLRAEEPARNARLLLSRAAAAVLREGLQLLGIEVPERM
jgi:arginyl-tRNA synthetase